MTKDERATKQKAVIYCRAASAGSNNLSTKLNGQQKRCEEFARSRGYDVIASFADHSAGNQTERPGLQGLQALVRKESEVHGAVIVLVEDLSRLARGVAAFCELHHTIAAVGGALEATNVEA